MIVEPLFLSDRKSITDTASSYSFFAPNFRQNRFNLSLELSKYPRARNIPFRTSILHEPSILSNDTYMGPTCNHLACAELCADRTQVCGCMC